MTNHDKGSNWKVCKKNFFLMFYFWQIPSFNSNDIVPISFDCLNHYFPFISHHFIYKIIHFIYISLHIKKRYTNLPKTKANKGQIVDIGHNTSLLKEAKILPKKHWFLLLKDSSRIGRMKVYIMAQVFLKRGIKSKQIFVNKEWI